MRRILIPNRLLNADDGGGGGGDPTPPAAPPSPAPAPVPVPAPALHPTASPAAPPAADTGVATLQARLATLETQLEADRAALRTERGARLIEQTAAAHGLDAGLLGRLVTPEFDEHGQPKPLDTAIASLLTTYPYLAKQSGPGGATTPASAGTSPANPARPPALTKAAIERMTPEQINTNWEAIQAFLARQS
ncbi:hypothetical protein [Herpetosiphon llansteffanensis]|uniref:hypothetical protein n=1 Tax=Herpetosiphon llansteffanensis TaxID=2094568 RepID=UPI0013DEB82E|nr:hypothetical protein [Herpetosiphon llansteffanensis]